VTGLGLALLAAACTPPLTKLSAAGEDPPELLAVYELDRGHLFYLWREADRIVQATAGSPSLREWRRSPAGEISHREARLDERLIVEYTSGDLRMLGALPAWEDLQGLAARELLAAPLTARSRRRYRGVEARRLSGSVGETEVEVIWLPSLHLAAELREHSQDGTRSLTLRQIYPLDRAPWRPPELRSFRSIDFADLGDDARLSHRRRGHVAASP
jgi:hypothetical protein